MTSKPERRLGPQAQHPQGVTLELIAQNYQSVHDSAADRVNLYIKATTGAIGTPKVQASPDELDLIEHPGVWFDLPITFTAADGSADFEYFVDIQVSSIRRIRVVFTGSNTAGLVSAVISGIGV